MLYPHIHIPYPRGVRHIQLQVKNQIFAVINFEMLGYKYDIICIKACSFQWYMSCYENHHGSARNSQKVGFPRGQCPPLDSRISIACYGYAMDILIYPDLTGLKNIRRNRICTNALAESGNWSSLLPLCMMRRPLPSRNPSHVSNVGPMWKFGPRARTLTAAMVQILTVLELVCQTFNYWFPIFNSRLAH